MTYIKTSLGIPLLLFSLLIGNDLLATDFYWVNGSGNWTDFTNHWVTTSGGTDFHDSIPGPNDRVFFDGNSFTTIGQTVTVDTSLAECLSIDFTGILFSPSFTGVAGDTLNVRDDFILASNLNWTYSGLLLFSNGANTDSTATLNDTADIYLRGLTIGNTCVFNGQGSWEMLDDFRTTGDIFFEQGKLTLLDDTLAAASFVARDPVDTTISNSASFSLNRDIDLGVSTIIISDAGSSWRIRGSATTITATSAIIDFTYTGADTLFFRSDSVNGRLGSVFFPSTVVVIEEGADINVVTLGSATDLRITPNVDAPFVFNTLIGVGNCGSYISIRSLTDGFPAYLRANTAASTLSFIRFQDLTLSGSTLTASQSLDDGNLSGPFAITTPTSNTTLYWINDGGNWTDPNQWSTTSGGVAGTCIPGPSDDVIFDANSFSVPNQTVNLDRNAYCASMDWSGIDENANMDGPADKLEVDASLTLSPVLNIDFSNEVRFTGTGNIATAQVNFPGPINFEGTAYIISDSLLSSQQITQKQGNVIATGKYISGESYIRESTSGTLTLSNSTLVLTGADTVWQPLNVVLGGVTTTGTSFRLTHSGQNGTIFNGDSLSYGSLIIDTKFTELLGRNSFDLLQVNPGNTLAIENEKVQTLDSLIASGSCDAPVFLQSVSPGTTPASILKSGFGSLVIDNVYITQLTADTTGGIVYVANNSIGFNDTEGWTINGSITGTDFYWIGGTGNWSDPANWSLTSGGTAGTCLPGIADNVIFDANSFVSATDTVFGDITAYFQNMDWSAVTQTPTFFQTRDLYPGGNVTLNANLTWDKQGLAAQMTFRPTVPAVTFDSKDIFLDTSIQLLSESDTSSLTLLSNLTLDTLSSIIITRGRFISNDFDLEAGTFFLATLEPKEITLGSSNVTCYFSWSILGITSGLTFDAGTSEIFVGGFRSQTSFFGNDETYYNVTIRPTEGANHLFIDNNTFQNLTLEKGTDVQFPSGGTQTILGDLTASGTCEDSIQIVSPFPSVLISTIDLSTGSQVSGECLNVGGIRLFRNGAAASETVFFSTDIANNTGFVFNAADATTAGFTTAQSICLDDPASFTNTSTAISGNVGDLSFIWDFGDGDSATTQNTTHQYLDGGDYPVTLTSTFTNGCFDTFIDTIEVREPEIILTTSEPNFTFCEGETVTLGISDSTLTGYTFFINGTIIATGADNEIETTQIQDGDQVYATAIVLGCTAISDTLTFTVVPGPNVQLDYLGISDTICNGDSVLFATSGAGLYEWFIDTVRQNFPSTDTSFLTTSLLDGQVVKVRGRDLATGCSAFSDDSVVFEVLPLPPVSLISDDFDQTICQGDFVTFTASGATTFEFFIDGNSQGASSTSTTFSTNLLQNNGIVSVEGIENGCANQNSLQPFIVNPTPNTSMTSSDPDTSICVGTSVNFTASGATAYQFLVNGVAQGPISGTNTFATSSLVDGDMVQAVGFIGDCGDTTGGFDFEVISLPTVGLSTSANDSICAGETVGFTASGASQYQFFVDGNAVGAIGPSNTFDINTLLTGEVVSVTGTTNGCPAPATQTFSFVVKPEPVVSLFKVSSGSTFCEGETVNFASLGADSYEFFVDGQSLGITTNGNLDISTLPPGNPEITVTGYTDGCSGISTDTLTVQITPLPTVTLTSSTTASLCQGDTIKVFASGATSYQFLIDGVAQGPSTPIDSLVLPNLQSGQVVQVVGTANACSDTSSTALTFTIDPVPVVSLGVSDPDLVICEGELVTFTGTGANQYEFFIDGTSIGPVSTTASFSTDTLQNQQTVTVIGTTGNCSAGGTNALILTVNPRPQVDLASSDPDSSICAGTPVTLTASGGATYAFFLDGVSLGAPGLSSQYITDSLTDGQIIQVVGFSNQNCPDTSGIIQFEVLPSPTVTLTSDDTNSRICVGDTVIFTAGGATDYEFFINGNSIQGPSSLTTYTTDTLTASQVISVVGSLGVCDASADTSFQFIVDTEPNPLLQLQGDDEICAGETLQLLASGAPQYQFFIDGTPASSVTSDGLFSTSNLTNGQVVSVVGINNACETAGDTSYQITVNDFPTSVSLTSSDPDLVVCFQDEITLTANGGALYEFFLNGNSFFGPDSSNTLMVTELENGDVITVSGAFGDCATPSNDVLTFAVNKLDLLLTSDPTNLLCEGDQVLLQASGADRYEFFLDDVSQGAPGVNAALLLSSATDGTIATFTGTDLTTGCVQTSGIDIYLRVLPAADIAPAGPIEICADENLVLNTQATGYIQWFLDGGPILGANEDSLQVTVSGSYTVATEQGGVDEVWTVGKNAQGQLGDSSNVDREVIRPVAEEEVIINSRAGVEHSLAVSLTGEVLAWGDNSFGQLGDGTFVDKNQPQMVPTIQTGAEVAGGQLHSLVRLLNGRIMAFGDNRAGQLGLGNNAVSNFPFEITTLPNAQKVAAGFNHSLALSNSGQLYTWGENTQGQLGIGNTQNQNTPQIISSLPLLQDISAGESHTLALTQSGDVYVWGSNARGQLGLGNVTFALTPQQLDFPELIQAISAGAVHSVFLGESGTVYVTGGNDQGQLGLGNLDDQFEIVEMDTLPDATGIFAAAFQTFIQLPDNSIFGTGRNVSGSLGNEDTVNISSPVYLPLLTGAAQITGGQDHLLVRMGYGVACESPAVSVIVNDAPELTIDQNGSDLTVQPAGASYQWFVDGNVIPSETGQSITPGISGDYTVEVTFANGCNRTSAPFPFVPVNIEGRAREVLAIYPNPTQHQLFIEAKDGFTSIEKVEIYDAVGKRVQDVAFASFSPAVMLDVQILPKGMYTVWIFAEGNQAYQEKIVVE
ncbi:MAG: PKD domain-containing protein [Bacteroidota bacterium]